MLGQVWGWGRDEGLLGGHRELALVGFRQQGSQGGRVGHAGGALDLWACVQSLSL